MLRLKRLALSSSLSAALVMSQASLGGGVSSILESKRARPAVEASDAPPNPEQKDRHALYSSRPAAVLPVTSCADDGSAGTLRNVMASAISGDTIDLRGVPCSQIKLTGGKIQTPFATSDIYIQGPGMDALTISGGHRSQIIENIGYGDLRITDVSFADGYSRDASGGCLAASRIGNGFDLTRVRVSGCEAHQVTTAYGGNIFGGGVFAIAEVILTDSIVTDNTLSTELTHSKPDFTDGLFGGGVGSWNGPLTVTRSTVSYNQIVSTEPIVGAELGGGLSLQYGYAFTITDSVISHNVLRSTFVDTSEYPTILWGAGVESGQAQTGAATMTIDNSTFEGNTVESAADVVRIFGGGLFTTMNAYVYGSTFVGNDSGYGGGLFPHGSIVSIVNSTISGNSATR